MRFLERLSANIWYIWCLRIIYTLGIVVFAALAITYPNDRLIGFSLAGLCAIYLGSLCGGAKK